MKLIYQYILLLMITSLLFLGDKPAEKIILLAPVEGDTISYDQGKLVLGSMLKDAGASLLVSTQWRKNALIPVGSKSEKENFPKEFYNLFEQKSSLQFLDYSLGYFAGYSKPETLNYAYTDSISIKLLWQKKEFVDFVKSVQSKDVLSVIINARGWKDSLYSTEYDDPNSDGRQLYKLHVKLIPGENHILFAPNGEKNVAQEYKFTYVNENVKVEDRPEHFHNSSREENCVSCHEGLPSADSGKSMTSDCNVCHKEKAQASFVHSPVADKECSSCHSWSPEKKMVVLESGIPETCFACHDDKKNMIDSAVVQHPVASDCATCHSPHGTDQPYLLKNDVYSLCTTCHTEQMVNHPVGRHPLRYVKNEETNEELSCVTCHNPHGSPNKSLLRFEGDQAQICSTCH